MTQEAKVYASDPQIEGMKNLQEGFKKNDIKLIMRELNDTKLNLMGDKLFQTYKDDLLRNVYLNALKHLCKPYKKVKLAFLGEKLNLNLIEIRSLLSELILENEIVGQIDQVNGLVELSAAEAQAAQKHRAIKNWGDILLDVHGKLRTSVKDNSSRDMWGMRGGGFGAFDF